jgi:segregation and condensation protein B
MAALETLAIVAYHQPVTAPEIQELRGVNPSGVLKTLLERRLIRISGRKEVVGKPFLYCTTREFLVHFGLETLDDLPPLEEFEEIFGEEGGSDAAPAVDRDEEFYREVAALEEQDGASEEAPEMVGLAGGTGGEETP